MGLIQCPSCGGKISDRATSCLHCGAAMKPAPAQTPRPAQEETPLQMQVTIPAAPAPAPVAPRSNSTIVLVIVLAVLGLAVLLGGALAVTQLFSQREVIYEQPASATEEPCEGIAMPVDSSDGWGW